MTDEPTVSVVVAAYNAERWIDEALQSACRQSLREIEILVVDDGSSDDTADRVRAVCERDTRVRLIQTENAGVGAARNVGIRAARGRYIAPLDADDVWAPEKLALQVQTTEEGGKEMGLVYCWSQHVDDAGRRLEGVCAHSVAGEVRREIILENFVGCASVPLFRASALRHVGLYLTRDEQGGVQGCEDWDLSIRVAEKNRVGVVKAVLVDYRQATSAMSTRADGMAKSFDILMERARQRNADLPSLLFRCAKGHFYAFLARKSHRNGDRHGCVWSVLRALRADPVTALDLKLLKIATWSLLGCQAQQKRVSGGGDDDVAQKPDLSSRRKSSFFGRIQALRRRRALGL